MGLLQDDQLWTLVMEDAKLQQLPTQMRELFVTLVVFSSLANPHALFEEFWESMSEDFEHQLILVRNTNNNLRKWMLG